MKSLRHVPSRAGPTLSISRDAGICRSCRRRFATATESAASPNVGDTLHGFTLKQVRSVPELELTAFRFQHGRTGARYLHLAKNDKNNVFTIGFKTNPPDRSGLPHILEHLTLCGSKHYPVRDPFFKMMPRSLNNFMNAMTYPDHTIYPFATTNHQDFKNLMSVYVDATLHPLLREHDFAQEGWRLGPVDPQAPTSTDNPIVFKGVVYNEMKGNMSSADYLFRQRWQDHIFPSLNDSGGDPQKMTELKYEGLVEFQKDHYNPSNARILTYGDMPMADHLAFLGPQMDLFENRNVEHDLKVPISLTQGPQTVRIAGPLDPLFPRDQQYKASVSWIMNDTADVLETFSLSLISSLLLDGFAAPIYRNTIEIGWGAAYTPNTGFDASAKTAIFSIGLSGLKKHDVSRINDGIRNTLRSVRRTGFQADKVDGRLHQIELELKNKTPQFGMELASRLQNGWFNGIDPFHAISPEEVVNAFRAKNEDPAYLTSLLERYWLKDDTFTFIMEPSEDFSANTEAEEALRLRTKIEDVTRELGSAEHATKSLERQEKSLLDAQQSGTDEDISCLPTVHVSDIPRRAERKDIRTSKLGDGGTIHWRETPTNGLTYFRGVQPFQDLPDDLRVYLPLFSMAVQRLGTRSMSVETLEDSIRLKTGGIGVSHHATTSPTDLSKVSEGLMFSGVSLDRNVPSMLELLGRVIHETDFTAKGAEDKISELIKGFASSALNDVADAGHAYARRFAEAGICEQSRLVEQQAGLTQTRLMMDLAARPQRSGYRDVIERLQAIQNFALTRDASMRIALTCGLEATSANEAHVQNFLNKLPAGQGVPESDAQVPYPQGAKSFFPLPYQVYYAALAVPTIPYTHEHSAPLTILANLLTHKRLHPEIREKGGAYGASAYSGALRGTFGYATYRDPNPERSLDVMRGTGHWAAEKAWTERDVEEAKLGVFQGIDAPESVADEGMAQFLHGIDPSQQQERREALLDVTPSQIRDVAEKYLAFSKPEVADRGNLTMLGPRSNWIDGEQGWIEMPMGASEGTEESKDGFLVL